MNSAMVRTRSVMLPPVEMKKAADAAFFRVLESNSNYVQVLDALVEILVLRHLAVQLDVQAHLVGRIGEAQRVLVADAAILEEIKEGLVEGLHSQLARLLHDLLDLVDLALEDEIGDQR